MGPIFLVIFYLFTSFQASGSIAAAATAFATSPIKNGITPAAIAYDMLRPNVIIKPATPKP